MTHLESIGVESIEARSVHEYSGLNTRAKSPGNGSVSSHAGQRNVGFCESSLGRALRRMRRRPALVMAF